MAQIANSASVWLARIAHAGRACHDAGLTMSAGLALRATARVRSVRGLRRDPGGDALGGFDRHRKGGAVVFLLLRAIRLCRVAHSALGEVRQIRPRPYSGHAKIARRDMLHCDDEIASFRGSSLSTSTTMRPGRDVFNDFGDRASALTVFSCRAGGRGSVLFLFAPDARRACA